LYGVLCAQGWTPRGCSGAGSAQLQHQRIIGATVWPIQVDVTYWKYKE